MGQHIDSNPLLWDRMWRLFFICVFISFTCSKTFIEKIKSYAYRYGFPKEVKDEYQVSWDLIPNDKLDPYSDAGWDKSKQFPKEGEVAIGG